MPFIYSDFDLKDNPQDVLKGKDLGVTLDIGGSYKQQLSPQDEMAKKFGVPLLSASQLNGNGEVRESKALEQDADTLLFIADDGVKVGKMRNGKRDQVLRLFLHGDVQKFMNYQPNQ